MKTMNQIVGENLKNLREIAGFTQEQTAKVIGIERSAYGNYEAGVREMPYNLVEKVADLFGCEPLLFFEDNIQASNELMETAFRLSDLEDNDLQEIAKFKDIMKSYLKMERIAQS